MPFLIQKGFIRERDGSFTTFEVDYRIGSTEYPDSVTVTDLNDKGEVIGYAPDVGFLSSSGILRRKDGTIVWFGGVPPKGSTADSTLMAGEASFGINEGLGAYAINARGEITGQVGGGSSMSGFLREPDGTTNIFNAGGVITSPQAINSFGQITGYYVVPGEPTRGFLRQPNGTIIQFVDTPNSTSTWPRSINLFSQITGFLSDTSGMHGFLRQANGKYVTFDPPGSNGTEAESINLHGEITGYYFTPDGKSHGFLRNAKGDIESFDAPGAGSVGTFPTGINDRGEIVGYYEDGNSIVHGFVRSRR